MIELITILTISVALNVFFAFYLKWLLKNFTFLSDNVYSLFETVESFSNHLSGIYELETFYGDETLQNLLAHARQVVEEIKTYENIYTITGSKDDLGDLFNDTKPEEKREEDQETLFYTSSWRRYSTIREKWRYKGENRIICNINSTNP